MIKRKLTYIPFENFIIREPLFSFEIFKFKNMNKTQISLFQEAIYLASPELFDELSKDNWIPKSKKHEIALYKYFSRACTRATPFGLFASCSIGSILEKNHLKIHDNTPIMRFARLDMNYICVLTRELLHNEELLFSLKFYPNDSLYKSGDYYRYIEYDYNSFKRIHKLSSVKINDYISLILKKAKTGVYIHEIVNYFVRVKNIESEDIKNYIFELIDVQILKSELDFNVTGVNPFDKLLSKISNINSLREIYKQLIKLKVVITSIQKQNDNYIDKYKEIENIVKQINIPYERKFLLQIDIYKSNDNFKLPPAIIENVIDAIHFLDLITDYEPNSDLSTFKEIFCKRFEKQELPLIEILDPELGIPYPNEYIISDNNEFSKNVSFPFNGSLNVKEKINLILFQKFVDCIKKKESAIYIDENDFQNKSYQFQKLPATLNAMISTPENIEDNSVIYVKSVGGNTATALLGRFCHINDQITKHTLNIAQKEEKLLNNYIIAEIVHLPEDRTGNILFRPILHKYEIHYLAQSVLKKEYQIPLSDLFISVRNDGLIMLRSKKLNAYILPRLSNAHNYKINSLPIYRFLCDLQSQEVKSGLGVTWDNCYNVLNYLPEIRYKNCVLSKQKWIIKYDKVKEWKKINNKNQLINTIKLWRKINKIPQYVKLLEGDNELLIDLCNYIAILTLINIGEKYKFFILEEYLLNGQIINNEVILSFYKNEA